MKTLKEITESDRKIVYDRMGDLVEKSFKLETVHYFGEGTTGNGMTVWGVGHENHDK